MNDDPFEWSANEYLAQRSEVDDLIDFALDHAFRLSDRAARNSDANALGANPHPVLIAHLRTGDPCDDTLARPPLHDRHLSHQLLNLKRQSIQHADEIRDERWVGLS